MGGHVPREMRHLKDGEFIEYDLNDCKSFSVKDKFDLLISLEVAEHLTGDKASSFIDMLTRLSDRIVFSAAIPGQTGENHFNEQYPHYWVKLFADQGYVVLDPFRKKYWKSSVNWWYAQNMFLFIKNDIPVGLQNAAWDGCASETVGNVCASEGARFIFSENKKIFIQMNLWRT